MAIGLDDAFYNLYQSHFYEREGLQSVLYYGVFKGRRIWVLRPEDSFFQRLLTKVLRIFGLLNDRPQAIDSLITDSWNVLCRALEIANPFGQNRNDPFRSLYRRELEALRVEHLQAQGELEALRENHQQREQELADLRNEQQQTQRELRKLRERIRNKIGDESLLDPTNPAKFSMSRYTEKELDQRIEELKRSLEEARQQASRFRQEVMPT